MQKIQQFLILSSLFNGCSEEKSVQQNKKHAAENWDKIETAVLLGSHLIRFISAGIGPRKIKDKNHNLISTVLKNVRSCSNSGNEFSLFLLVLHFALVQPQTLFLAVWRLSLFESVTLKVDKHLNIFLYSNIYSNKNYSSHTFSG